MEDYGIKVSKVNKSALSKNRRDFGFTSSAATYMVVKVITAVVNANPYVIIHNLGYIPKVIIYHVLSDHNRKLPYNDDTLTDWDFSITKNEVKIRGVTSGTFRIYIFAQETI